MTGTDTELFVPSGSRPLHQRCAQADHAAMHPAVANAVSLRRPAASSLRRCLIAALFVLLWTGPQAVGQSRADNDAQFQQRLSRIDASDTEALIDLAQWAVQNALPDQADELYRKILFGRPDNRAAYDALCALRNGRPLSLESESLAQVRTLLPNFTEHETKHFVIVSDAPRAVVQQHATRLEQTWHEFDRYVRRLDLRPLPLRYKLVCVLFNDRDDYTSFAQTNDELYADWVAGYYTPKFDRSVFYNAQSNPGVVEARGQLANMQAQVEQARSEATQINDSGAAHKARVMRGQIDQYRAQLEQQRRNVDEFADQLSTATTVHETVHQLLFHTHVQSPYVEYPLWISEGLATAFETADPGSAFGPDFDFQLRRSEFQYLLREDRLIPLRDLVSMTATPEGNFEMVRTLYHESYALLTWMNRSRRSEMVEYLRLMRRHEPGRLTTKQHLELFQQAFGDIDKLERAWLASERASTN